MKGWGLRVWGSGFGDAELGSREWSLGMREQVVGVSISDQGWVLGFRF